MKAQDFAWFLHGYFQIHNPISIDARQTCVIRAYLESMFKETQSEEDEETKALGDADKPSHSNFLGQDPRLPHPHIPGQTY